MDALDEALAALPRYDASESSVLQILEQAEQERAEKQRAETETPERDGASARPRFRPAVVWGALAASLLVGVGLWFTLASDEAPAPSPVTAPRAGLTLKGAAVGSTDATISLGLSLLRDEVPVALVPGATARVSDTVLMRYTTDSSGYVYLFRLGPDDALEVFHGTPTIPGTHHVTVDGRIVGYELDGLRGEHLFGIAFSPDPWAPGEHGEAALAPAFLKDSIAPHRAFPQTVGEITVDARVVRLDPPRQ